MVTHYERLGVEPDADRETIWRAYLAAVRTALSSDHPGPRLRVLEEAWVVLRDADTRAAYDHALVGQPAPPEGAHVGEDLPMADDDAVAVDASAPGDSHDEAQRDEAQRDEAQRDEAQRDEAQRDEAQRDEAQRDEAPAGAALAAVEERSGATDEDAPEPEPGWAAARGRARPRRRRATVVAVWALALVIGGAAAGLGLRWLIGGLEDFAEGSCVSLTAAEAFPVACDAPDADGLVTAVVVDAEDCGDVDGGWVERDDGRLACVQLLSDG